MRNFKKILCMLLFSGASTVYAQDIYFGGVGGLNLATFTNLGSASVSIGGNSSSVKNPLKLGAHIGVYSEIKISEIFSVQPELHYSMKGYKSNQEVVAGGTTTENDYSFTSSYIDIPVQARFNLGKGFYLVAGPYM